MLCEVAKAADVWTQTFASEVSSESAREGMGKLTASMSQALPLLQDCKILVIEVFWLKALKKLNSQLGEDAHPAAVTALQTEKAKALMVLRQQRVALQAPEFCLNDGMICEALLSRVNDAEKDDNVA